MSTESRITGRKKPNNKAIMDQPAEEFIAPDSSHPTPEQERADGVENGHPDQLAIRGTAASISETGVGQR